MVWYGIVLYGTYVHIYIYTYIYIYVYVYVCTYTARRIRHTILMAHICRKKQFQSIRDSTDCTGPDMFGDPSIASYQYRQGCLAGMIIYINQRFGGGNIYHLVTWG